MSADGRSLARVELKRLRYSERIEVMIDFDLNNFNFMNTKKTINNHRYATFKEKKVSAPPVGI